jgi:hypothetical protein
MSRSFWLSVACTPITVAMGPAVRARIATVLTPPPAAHQRQLGYGRDLRPGKRQVALSLPSGGFQRRHPRVESEVGIDNQ